MAIARPAQHLASGTAEFRKFGRIEQVGEGVHVGEFPILRSPFNWPSWCSLRNAKSTARIHRQSERKYPPPAHMISVGECDLSGMQPSRFFAFKPQQWCLQVGKYFDMAVGHSIDHFAVETRVDVVVGLFFIAFAN